MKDDEGDSGLQDAIDAFFEAGKKEDWKGAEQAFRDMWRLVDVDSEKEDPEAEDDKKEKGKPLAAIILGKK
jgi:hypothetical protein